MVEQNKAVYGRDVQQAEEQGQGPTLRYPVHRIHTLQPINFIDAILIPIVIVYQLWSLFVIVLAHLLTL